MGNIGFLINIEPYILLSFEYGAVGSSIEYTSNFQDDETRKLLEARGFADHPLFVSLSVDLGAFDWWFE